MATATTYVDERPVIRTRADAQGPADLVAPGPPALHHPRGDRLVSGNYPFIGDPVSRFRATSVELLDPTHPGYALRPAEPLQVVAASSFYAPRDSFVYPGGEADMGPASETAHHTHGADRLQVETAAV